MGTELQQTSPPPAGKAICTSLSLPGAAEGHRWVLSTPLFVAHGYCLGRRGISKYIIDVSHGLVHPGLGCSNGEAEC